MFTSLEPSGVYELVPGIKGESVEAQYARHTLLPTPACTGPALRDVFVRPTLKAGVATGFYQCFQNGIHFYEIGTSTKLELGNRSLITVDENDAALVSQTAAGLFIVQGGALRPLVGVSEPSGSLVAVVTMSPTSRAVVRFRTDRAPEMLYDEAKSPTGMKILRLVSGT